MVRENHKMVREKSGNFVRAHGWTPWLGIADNGFEIVHGPMYLETEYSDISAKVWNNQELQFANISFPVEMVHL